MSPWSLVDVIGTVAESQDGSADLTQMLGRITRTARDTIPHTDYVSVLVRYSDGHLVSRAATDPAISRVDAQQCLLHEGPGYDAVAGGVVTDSGDLGTDRRWPAYGPRASALGLRSQLAMRVHDSPRACIALNLYSRDRAAFGHPAEAARVLVGFAEMILASAGDLNGLRDVVAPRRDVSEALGVYDDRYGADEARASDRLVRVSRSAKVRVRDVARQIVGASRR